VTIKLRGPREKLRAHRKSPTEEQEQRANPMFKASSMLTVATVAAGVLPRVSAFAPASPAVLAGGLRGRLPLSPQAGRRVFPSVAHGVRMVAAESAEKASDEPQPSPDFKFNMEDITSVCKRRGFIFPSSEIYQGFAGFYDYGPLGVEMKNNIKKIWWRDMVHRRDDMVGLDSSIIAAPAIWKSSGHVDGFSDPMVDCKESKLRYRADQLFYGKVQVDDEVLGYISLMEADDMQEQADKTALKMKKKAGKQGELKPVELREVAECPEDELALVPSPATGKPGSLTPPRAFNLMFQTQVGAMSDAASTAYLRPETAQGIFVNFKNVQQTARTKVPFGIAQV
jgi:glycyl-tRNA synthetase